MRRSIRPEGVPCLLGWKARDLVEGTDQWFTLCSSTLLTYTSVDER